MKLGNPDKFWAFGGEVGRSATRFLLGILVARWAGPEVYGIYVLLITVEVILHTVANSIWAVPMGTIAPALESEPRKALIAHAVRRHWQATWASGLALLLSMPFALAHMPTSHYLAFAATVVLAGGLNIRRAQMVTSFRAQPMFFCDFGTTLFPIVAVGVAWFTSRDVVLAFWASRAIGSALSIVALKFVAPIEAGAADVDLTRMKSMGKHMLLGSMANSVCSRVHPFVLAAVATPLQLGVFGAANALLGPMRMLTMAVAGVLRPRLALHFGQNGGKKGWLVTTVAFGVMGVGGVVGTLGLVFLGTLVAELVFGGEFEGLGRLLPVAAVYATIASINNVGAVVIQTIDSAKTTTKLRTWSGVLSILLVWPACAGWGEFGAFYSLILAEGYYLVAGGMRILSVKRERQRSLSLVQDASAVGAGGLSDAA